MDLNKKENPLYEQFDRVCNLMKKYDAVLSLGNGIRAGAIHCMATDSHDTRERSAIIVRRGAEELARLVGRKNLALLSVENPAKVLNGSGMTGMNVDAIPRYRPIGGGGRGFWEFFRRKKVDRP